MAYQSRQKQQFDASAPPAHTIETVTSGIVADTNDPQQNGRIRVVCLKWGDSLDTPVEDLPWATYMSPFIGHTSSGTKGPGIQETDGRLSYGMWAIPKVGATAVVCCLDGNPATRIWMGCLPDQFSTNTMPHGRFIYDDHPALDNTVHPVGPLSSNETQVLPLDANIKKAFGNQADPNYEWRNRAADYTVSGIGVENLGFSFSGVADDQNVAYDNWMSTQGYGVNRVDPNGPSTHTDKNYDSSVYAFTSPGFHALSMDDRQENCRIRLRTSSGHQIILDDTNERIYIATTKGNNWVEMDSDGNIDVFTTKNLSARAGGDINLTSDKTIRMYASDTISLVAGNEIRIESGNDAHIRSGGNIRAHAASSLYLQSGVDTNVYAGNNALISSVGTTDVKAGTELLLSSAGNLNLSTTTTLIGTANIIHWNGPTASVAATALPATELPGLWTSRVPTHEPFARTMTADDFSHTPEFSYTDPNVNKSERGTTIIRGMYWRR